MNRVRIAHRRKKKKRGEWKAGQLWRQLSGIKLPLCLHFRSVLPLPSEYLNTGAPPEKSTTPERSKIGIFFSTRKTQYMKINL